MYNEISIDEFNEDLNLKFYYDQFKEKLSKNPNKVYTEKDIKIPYTTDIQIITLMLLVNDEEITTKIHHSMLCFSIIK